MKKLTCTAIAALVTLTAGAFADFTPPTEAQIQDAAENTFEIADLLVDATDDQAVEVIGAVVAAIDKLDLKQIEKKRRCGDLFAAVDIVLGRDRAKLILSRVVATMPRGIVPNMGTGAPFNIPYRPQSLRKYARQ